MKSPQSVLAWLTYYGSALAACHRGHLGFPGLFLSLPKPLRGAAFITAEIVVIGFFAVVGYAGWYLLGIFGEETLVSLELGPSQFYPVSDSRWRGSVHNRRSAQHAGCLEKINGGNRF